MKIRAGETIIEIRDVYADNEYANGKVRPSLRVSSDNPLTDAEVAALLGNDWELFENGGHGEYVASTQKGFGAVHRHQVVFIQTETAEEREATLRRRIVELEAEKENALQELDAFKVSVPENADDTKKGDFI